MDLIRDGELRRALSVFLNLVGDSKEVRRIADQVDLVLALMDRNLR